MQEYNDYLGMVHKIEKDNHTPKTFAIHALALLFAAHTNTGSYEYLNATRFALLTSLTCYSWYHSLVDITPGTEQGN